MKVERDLRPGIKPECGTKFSSFSFSFFTLQFSKHIKYAKYSRNISIVTLALTGGDMTLFDAWHVYTAPWSYRLSEFMVNWFSFTEA